MSLCSCSSPEALICQATRTQRYDSSVLGVERLTAVSDGLQALTRETNASVPNTGKESSRGA